MFSFLKKFIRTGIIALVLIGTAAAVAVGIAGPDRTHAMIGAAHTQVLQAIDANIDDPTVLRRQLREMEKEYPARISQVREDLAELNEQVRQLGREQAICERVVELADLDLGEIQMQLSQAIDPIDGSMNRLSSTSTATRGASSRRLTARARQVENTRGVYLARASDADHDLGFLNQQAVRLEGLLQQLEDERAQFKGQILALSRQVDAIARNERLIALMEKRNRTIEECSRYEAVSLDQISGRLSEIRAGQEAELDFLSREQEQGDYEDLARMQIATESLEDRLDDFIEGEARLLPGNR
jgi:hypothetical protein